MTNAHILIIKLSAIGDVVHALPVATAIKRNFPQARIAWMVEKAAWDLVEGNPHIDTLLFFDKPRYKKIIDRLRNMPILGRQLRLQQFDMALDLQGLFKSAAISWLSGARRRYVYCNARELSQYVGQRILGPHTHGHIVEQYLDVARAIGCQIERAEWAIVPTQQEQVQVQKLAAQDGWELSEPYAMFLPGTNWENKRWLPERFAQVGDWLMKQGLRVVVAGSAGDRVLAQNIAAHMRHKPHNWTGATSLRQLAYGLQQARVAVGGDTGPVHLAVAMGSPVVELMGPTDAIRNGPYGQPENAICVNRDCQGCWRRKCPKGWDCLAAITVEQVTRKLQDVLQI